LGGHTERAGVPFPLGSDGDQPAQTGRHVHRAISRAKLLFRSARQRLPDGDDGDQYASPADQDRRTCHKYVGPANAHANVDYDAGAADLDRNFDQHTRSE
jgi:hypothetical protein